MAEVCNLPNRTPPTLPTGLDVTTVPPATDLSSALAAINALRGIVQNLSRQITPAQRIQRPGSVGVTTKPSKSNPKPSGPWKEVERKVETVRVENPNDSSQFVVIERINRIVMQNTATGERWTWKR